MSYRAWFQCIDCSRGRYPLNDVVYECGYCGGLLQVEHDMGILGSTPGVKWRELWESRYRETQFPYGSSVWGKKELVCPSVADENIVSMYEGGSNLFWADRLGREVGVADLWVKQCGNSHTGSFKDLGMTVLVSMVNQMRSEGKDIPAVACASTGDTSAALAAYCAAAEIPAIVFLPKGKVSTSQLIQPIANGALTLTLGTDFDGCMALMQKICQHENIYLANSKNSLRIEGQKTISMELLQQQDSWDAVPDWVVIPGGNLGNVTAIGKGFADMKALGVIDRLPRILVAQAANADPLYRSYLREFREFKAQKARSTMASAIQIGNPVSKDRAIRTLRQFDGMVEHATEDELAEACARADRTGLFTCPHTGVALAALIKLIDRQVVKREDKVIVISTAHGLKFPDFKVAYHEGHVREDLRVNARYRNQPIDVKPDYEEVRSVILHAVDQRTSTCGSGMS